MFNRRRVITGFVIVWILAVAGAFHYSQKILFEHDRSLIRNYKTTTGTVSDKTLGHQYVGYTFTVGGEEFKGSTSSSYIAETYEEIQIGDVLTVYFDSTNPRNSNGYLPDEASLNWRDPLILMISIGPLTFFFLALAFETGIITRRPNG
jgi:hypothetical protein